jgi:pilus assembly protein Flp/PilA
MYLKFHFFTASKTHQKEKKMNWMILKVKSFFSEEDGVTAIEYGLIAALLSVVIIVSVTAVGTNLDTVFNSVATALAP